MAWCQTSGQNCRDIKLKTCERVCSGVLDFCVLLDCSFGGFLCCSGDIYVISLVPVHMQHPDMTT